MKVITLKRMSGSKTNDAIKYGIDVARAENCEVRFTTSLNGVYVVLDPDSEFDIVIRDFQRSKNGCIGKTIGPRYEKVLSRKTIEREKMYLEEKEKAQRLVWEAESQVHIAKWKRAIAELKMIWPAEMTFLDAETEKVYRQFESVNRDTYSSIILRIANDYACLMEHKLGSGSEITEDLVNWCEQIIVDFHEPSGFQFMTAQNILVEYWIYGAEFYPFTHRAKLEERKKNH